MSKVTITKPPAGDDWWIRIYAADVSGSSWAATLTATRRTADVNLAGNVVFWLGQLEDTTTHEDQRPWKTKATRGYCIAPLSPQTRLLEFRDPSVRDAQQNYLVVDRAEITIVGASAIEEWRAPLDIPRLMQLGADEMADFFSRKKGLQASMKPIIPFAFDQFLNRFTTVNGQLPAAAFAAVGEYDPPMARDVLIQLIGFGCNMRGSDVKSFLEDLHKYMADPYHRADLLPSLLQIIVEACVFTAVSCIYVGDHAGKRDVERFQIGVSQRLGQGDCDDVSKETKLCIRSIQKMRLSPTDPLRHVVALLNEYEAVMLTGVATSPSLRVRDASEGGTNPDDYITHLWTMMVPKSIVGIWTGEEHRFESANPSLQHILANIGALVCEGTNFTDALHRPLTAYWSPEEARRQAQAKAWRRNMHRLVEEQEPALRKLDFLAEGKPTMKEPTTFDEQSGFYRVVMTMWVAPRDEGCFAYHLTLGDHFGVSFKDFVECNTSIRATPCYERRLNNADLQAALGAQPPRKPLQPHKMYMKIGPGKHAGKNFIEYRLQHPNQATPAVREALHHLDAKGDLSFSRFGLAKNIHGLTQIKFYPSDN